MSKTSQTPRIELLKQLKSNVNSFAFTPTESKRKAVESSIQALQGFIEAIEVVAEKPKASKSKRKPKASKKSVRRPKRSSSAGLELAQAETATANKVGKVKKTKVVNAITEGDAMPFEPRKEVPVVEPKVRKKEQMKLTLLPGETPEEAMARRRSAQIEAARLEAEALIADTAPLF